MLILFVSYNFAKLISLPKKEWRGRKISRWVNSVLCNNQRSKFILQLCHLHHGTSADLFCHSHKMAAKPPGIIFSHTDTQNAKPNWENTSSDAFFNKRLNKYSLSLWLIHAILHPLQTHSWTAIVKETRFTI